MGVAAGTCAGTGAVVVTATGATVTAAAVGAVGPNTKGHTGIAAIAARAAIIEERAVGEADQTGRLNLRLDVAQAEVADHLPAVVKVGAVIHAGVSGLGGFGDRADFRRTERIARRDLAGQRIVEGAIADAEERVGRLREGVDFTRLLGRSARQVFLQEAVRPEEMGTARQRRGRIAALEAIVERARQVREGGEIIDEGTARDREFLARQPCIEATGSKTGSAPFV